MYKVSHGGSIRVMQEAGQTVLYLTRKAGDAIVINENIEITVISVSGKTVKLGFAFPPDVSVLRKEVHDRIRSENLAAAENAEIITNITLPLSIKLPPAAPLPVSSDDETNQ